MAARSTVNAAREAGRWEARHARGGGDFLGPARAVGLLPAFGLASHLAGAAGTVCRATHAGELEVATAALVARVAHCQVRRGYP